MDSVLQISVESWCWIEIETWRGAAKMRLSLRELSQELNNVLRTKCLIKNEGKPKTVDMKTILYFHTRTDNFIKNVLLLASFWKWGFLELGNDLFLVRFVFGGLQRSQRLYLFSDRVQDDDANRKFRGKCKEELMYNSCFQQVKSHSLTLYFIMVSLWLLQKEWSVSASVTLA